MSTETESSQEFKPTCQRGDCPWDASRRVTIETTQEVATPVTLYGITFCTIINRLVFLERRMTVDLCVTCYHTLKQDKTLQLLSVVGIGPYAEGHS